MPTPQELKKIAEAASKAKSEKEAFEYAKSREEKSKRDVENDLLAQEKAKAVIAHAEANMSRVAKEGLFAALVYQAEGYEIIEQSLRSLHSGAKVDSPDRFFCSGVARIVFDHFKSKEYTVVVVSQPGPADSDGTPTSKYFIKVGW